jgi:hypothetical protein
MRARSLELRDLEILRTILRLRFVPTRLLNPAFFSSERNGRRRLQRLSDRDLIRPHQKGVEWMGYSAWRITSRGLDTIVDAFPDEPVVDGVMEKINQTQLRNLFHQEALSNLYLRLVIPPPAPEAAETKPAACRPSRPGR